MKLMTLITLIVLILLMGLPTQIQFSHSVAGANAMVENQYIIKEINSTACDYSITWKNSSQFSVQAGDYYNVSGVSINSQNDQYNLSLCWKPFSVYSLSEMEIKSYHLHSFFVLYFGVKDHMYIFSNSSGSLNVTKFQEGSHITMGIYWDGSKPYVVIENNAGQFLFRPPVIETKVNCSSLLLTGNYYFMNVSLLRPVQLNSLNSLNLLNKFRELDQINTNSIQFAGSNRVHPLYDRTLSIFIMPSQDGNIYAFNPWNHRIEEIYNRSTIFNNVFSYQNYAYMISSSQNSMQLLKINESNLNITSSTYNMTGTYFVSMYHNYPHIFFRYYFENLSSGKITDIDFSNIQPNGSFFEVSSVNSINYFVYNNSILHKLILKGNEVTNEINFTHIDSIIQIGYSNGGPVMEVKFNSTQIFMIANSKEIIFKNATMYEGGLYMENNISQTLLLNGSSFSILPIPMNGFSGSLSHGIVWSENSFYLYGNFIQRGLINLSWKNETIRYSGFLNFTVQSNTSYTIDLDISQLGQYYSDSGAFFLNVSRAMTGKYVFEVTAENLEGLVFSDSGYFYIDNSIPNISFNRSLSHGVYGGESISILARDLAGVREMGIHMNGKWSMVNGSSLNFTIPDLFKGNTLNFTISVKDVFNYTTNYSISVSYYGERGFTFGVNIHNGEIINHNLFNFRIYSKGGNISYFLITFQNNTSDRKQSFKTTGSIDVNLSNGEYYYCISAIFKAGNSQYMGNGTIIVNSEHPVIRITGLQKKYFSHIQDSTNRSFNVTLNSSMNGIWNVRIVDPKGQWISMESSNRTFVIPVNEIYNFTSNSGLYTIYGNFTSFNGFKSNSTSYFIMDNILPDTGTSFYIYTNQSLINISKCLVLPTGYDILLTNSGNILRNYSFRMKDQGNYTLSMKIINKAMAYETYNITIVYSTEKPSFRVNGLKNNIYNRTQLQVNVSSSGIPIKKIYVNTSLNYRISSNEITFFFQRDGSYKFTINVQNLCGNYNNETYHINIFSFPYITNMKIRYRENFQNFHGVVYIYGYHLKQLNVSWIINGKFDSNRSTVNLTLPPGIDELCVVVHFKGGSKYENLSIFSIPEYGFLLGISSAIIIIIYRYVPFRFSQIELGQLIMNSDGITVRKLNRIIKRKHFSKRRFKIVMEKLKNSGYIRTGKDLNGDDCIKIVKLKKK
ncbi:hypothetical protein ACNF42_03360 [Cuniculiplasma sp. SKW3]|uniref:hypothetical protein n=1 Tax=Cuniculiplasma sp. SKW3 TaxID=3400170 RepID=UPI003FCF21C4